eukprot:COSAG01_NODE_50012_length_367_cov_0.776119_2_plen_21_part_01
MTEPIWRCIQTITRAELEVVL